MPRDVEIQGKQEVQRLVSCKKRTGRAPQERKKKYVHVKTDGEWEIQLWSIKTAGSHQGLGGGVVSSLKPSSGPADTSLWIFGFLGDNKILLIRATKSRVT